MATKRKKTEKRVTYEVEAEWPDGWLVVQRGDLPLARRTVRNRREKGFAFPLRIVKVTREVVR